MSEKDRWRTRRFARARTTARTEIAPRTARDGWDPGQDHEGGDQGKPLVDRAGMAGDIIGKQSIEHKGNAEGQEKIAFLF